MTRTHRGSRSIGAGPPTMGFSLAMAPRQRSICVGGLSKSQAEDLLDWLEANAYGDCHLSYIAGKGFMVSYAEADTRPRRPQPTSFSETKDAGQT